jgi:hypothetical protein
VYEEFFAIALNRGVKKLFLFSLWVDEYRKSLVCSQQQAFMFRVLNFLETERPVYYHIDEDGFS